MKQHGKNLKRTTYCHDFGFLFVSYFLTINSLNVVLFPLWLFLVSSSFFLAFQFSGYKFWSLYYLVQHNFFFRFVITLSAVFSHRVKHLASSSASSFTQNSLCPLFSSGSFRDFRRHRGTRLVVRADSVSAFFNISFDGVCLIIAICVRLYLMSWCLFCFAFF